MKRRQFIQQSTLAAAGLLAAKYSFALPGNDFPVVRVPLSQRKFSSPAIEKIIAEVEKNIGNKEIAWLFGNCFPNTLDTTVDFEMIDGKPDTYVITGDIDAMWLRDSSAQVWPYLPFCKEDPKLKLLIQGVIRRQTKFILLDPYANAFYKDVNKVSEWKKDLTDMKPGIHERKWEIDSLCYPIRLAYGYWRETGDTSVFDEDWKKAMKLVVKTFKEQQRIENDGPYHFQRETAWATDGVPMAGYGYPAKKVGLIHSMFRPSDDVTLYPFLIPSNLFAQTALNYVLEIYMAVFTGTKAGDDGLQHELFALLNDLKPALEKYAKMDHPDLGKVIPYEINGYGSCNMMDDANVPSLLALSYLETVKPNDPYYVNTRRFVLSEQNPFFYKGKAGEGIGGPHVGKDYIWPMSIIMRGLTSSDDKEIKDCIDMLQRSHAGTGFMHESFHKDDASKFTRKWFAWANTLFGEFILKVYKERRYLLK